MVLERFSVSTSMATISAVFKRVSKEEHLYSCFKSKLAVVKRSDPLEDDENVRTYIGLGLTNDDNAVSDVDANSNGILVMWIASLVLRTKAIV